MHTGRGKQLERAEKLGSALRMGRGQGFWQSVPAGLAVTVCLVSVSLTHGAGPERPGVLRELFPFLLISTLTTIQHLFLIEA